MNGLSGTPAPTKGRALTALAPTTRKNINSRDVILIQIYYYNDEKNMTPNNISTNSIMNGLSGTPAPTKGRALTALAPTTRKNINSRDVILIQIYYYNDEKNMTPNNISTNSIMNGLSRTPAPTKGEALTASAPTTRTHNNGRDVNKCKYKILIDFFMVQMIKFSI